MKTTTGKLCALKIKWKGNNMKYVIKITLIYALLFSVLCAMTIDIDSVKINKSAPSCWGPTAFTVSKKEIIISDNLNNRTLHCSLTGGYISADTNTYSCYSSQLFFADSGDIHTYYSGKAFAVEDSSGQKKVYVSFERSGYTLKDNRSIIFDGNALIAQLSNDSLISIVDPGTDNLDNISRIQGHQKTLEYLQDNSTGLAIEYDDNSEKYYITRSGVLQTFDYGEFVSFYTIENNKLPNGVTYQDDITKIHPWKMTFIGHDIEGNWYWKHEKKSILVFDTGGALSKIVDIRTVPSSVLPAVHHNGDIYFLHYDEKTVVVEKISK